MQLTTDHSTSSYGIPVFLDDDGNVMDYAPAIVLICKTKGWTYADLAERTGVSPRTAEGWGQGRMPSKSALMLLASHL